MSGLFKNFYYFCLFLGILFGVFVCILTHMMFVCAPQKKISDLLGLKLQPVVNHLMWVLGTEFGSFKETENTHNCWAIFPHYFFVLRYVYMFVPEFGFMHMGAVPKEARGERLIPQSWI